MILILGLRLLAIHRKRTNTNQSRKRTPTTDRTTQFEWRHLSEFGSETSPTPLLLINTTLLSPVSLKSRVKVPDETLVKQSGRRREYWSKCKEACGADVSLWDHIWKLQHDSAYCIKTPVKPGWLLSLTLQTKLGWLQNQNIQCNILRN